MRAGFDIITKLSIIILIILHARGSIILKKNFKTLIIPKRSLWFVLAFIVAASAAAGLKGTGAYAVYYGNASRKLPVYSVEREDKKIAITFDCAWGAEKTRGLLSRMEEYGVKCTFFMTEFWAENFSEIVSEIHNAGHEIGTHSATHSHMSKMKEDKIREEIESSSRAIEDITGEKVTLFRPPFGDYNDRLIKVCEDMGFFAIQWDVDSLDWKDVSANDIATRIISKTAPGSIILCHNNAENTLDALPHIFSNLIGRGYEFVRVGDLIYKDNYTVDVTGRQRPADRS